jgi:RimJ/RimL family protein N-acetyltransferase
VPTHRVLICATEIGIAGPRLVEEVLGTDEPVSSTEVHNVRSRAVMQHLGMSFVGEIRALGLVDDEESIDDEA